MTTSSATTNGTATQKDPATPANATSHGPRITAFYGFKGGTGRSFLLATCAVALAAAGKRVLVLDWDLEAPGVGDLFDSSGNNVWVEWRRHKGIVELTQDSRFPPRTRLTDDNRQELATTLLQTLFPSPPADPSSADSFLVDIVSDARSRGRLSLIGPGQYRSGTYYFGNFLESDWTWYFANRGTDFFELLRDVMLTQPHFDEILIDARTGYSAFSVAAIRHLADTVCVVGTFSMQSINGVARVWPLLQREDRIRPYHILSRSPRNLPHRLQADIEGKRELLKEYGCEAFCELPVISNLHGGDGHLWSRDELLERTAAETAGGMASDRSGGGWRDAALEEYLGTLVDLLREVFGPLNILDGRQLTERANQWWREFGNNRKIISQEFGGNLSWAEQQYQIEQELDGFRVLLTDVPAVRRDAGTAPVEGVSSENVGPSRNPGAQSHRLLPARALLAARVSRKLRELPRPPHVTDEAWQARREEVQFQYGADVSPIPSDQEDGLADVVRDLPQGPPLQAVKDMREAVTWGVDPTREWFAERDLAIVATIAQRCAAGSERVSLFRDAKADHDVLEALQIHADVLEIARLLNRSANPLNEELLRRAAGVALERLLEELRENPFAQRSLKDRLDAHDRLARSIRQVHDLAPSESSATVMNALRAIERAFVARADGELDERIAYWSEQVVKQETRLLLPSFVHRAEATQAIHAVADDYASVAATIDRTNERAASRLGDVAALGERLGRLCYEIYEYEPAVRCLLPAMRLDPMRMMAETADLCLVRLGSPNALRATQEVAQRYRQSVSGEKPDAAKQVEILSIAALGREWRHFGAGHRIESDGSSRYATYKTCLRELDEWLDRARDKKGAFIAREREWMRPFYVNWQLELGEDVDQEWTANPEPNHWVSLQRARFLLATERFSEAAEAMERESSRMPEGSLSAEEPRALFYVAFSVLSGLLGALYKGAGPDLHTWYVRAREAMDTFDAIVARRGFPFDRDLEVQVRRGLRTKWRTAAPAIGDERLSYQRLGLSTGVEWPALSRVDFAMILLDYAELCMRCEEMTTARSSIKSTLALLDLTKNREVPARGFTGPLSARMALPAALALAMQARLFDEPEALKTALAWAAWDCSDEVNGAGRKAYYSRVLTWCSAGTPMHKPVQTWLSR